MLAIFPQPQQCGRFQCVCGRRTDNILCGHVQRHWLPIEKSSRLNRKRGRKKKNKVIQSKNSRNGRSFHDRQDTANLVPHWKSEKWAKQKHNDRTAAQTDMTGPIPSPATFLKLCVCVCCYRTHPPPPPFTPLYYTNSQRDFCSDG